MKMRTFKGGIFPPEMKELSQNSKITDVLPSSKTVTIPVTMGGAPNSPVVKVGDTVKRGQIIAKSDKFMSAPVHASVSGKVKKIASFLVTGNNEVPCITIEMDDTQDTDFMQPIDPFSVSKEECLARIKEAGIVGMGGASFPTHVKLTVAPDKKIDYVILNAAECEPFLTVDDRTLAEDAEKVIDGLSIAMHIVNAKGKIALESNKKDKKELLEKIIKEKALRIDVEILKTKYPQGCEKNIIDAVMGKEIPAGKLPADVGAVIINVGSACAISESFRLGKPLIDRPLTISGGACVNPQNIRVPVGTVVSDLIPSQIQVKEDELIKILSGGPMMGFAMPSTDFPIAKGTSGITFLSKKDACIKEESQCINCGRCVNVCPMKLTPVMIVKSVKTESIYEAKEYGLMDCIECGSCAYVCPASIQLVQRIRVGKSIVRSQMSAGSTTAQNANGGKK